MANLPSPFGRHSEDSLTTKAALEHYRQYGFLWVRLHTRDRRQDSTMNVLRTEFASSSNAYRRNWSVENLGDCRVESELSPDSVFCSDKEGPSQQFYVSTIIHRNKPEVIDRLLTKCLPFERQPPLLGESRHDGGAWLFLGRNNVRSSQSNGTGKRKRKAEPSVLAGRAEHVDEVSHSGTWHVQLSGTKTWLLRPNTKSSDWQNVGGSPDLRLISETEQSDKGGRAWRLRITVEEGDLFVLNTRAWYHQTILSPSPDWSISLARDFSLPAPELLSPRDAQVGDIIFDEEDIPDELPRASKDGNCALAEIENDDNGSDEETRIALVAIKDIKTGESLVLSEDGAQDEGDPENGEDDGEYNAAEGIDPRAIADKNWHKNDCVLSGDDIPEDLPRSLEPNCEIVDDKDAVVLRALCAVACGEVLTVLPDDNEEYEEVEVELGTGEMIRTQTQE